MMSTYAKLGVVVGLAVAIGAVVILKQGGAKSCCPGPMPVVTQESPAEAPAPVEASSTVAAPRPKLVELGSAQCMACKAMKPIIDELAAVYKGTLEVEFVDVNQTPQEAARYGIRVIPTQIFLAPDGRELFRHEGFFAKEDILAKWKEVGFDLAGQTQTGQQ